MGLDLDVAQERFAESTDGTVGLEEEFALLDPGTLDLIPKFEELQGAAAGDELLKDSIAGELISSEIEIRSGPGSDFTDAIARQRERRARLFALAQHHSLVLAATGTHPWADYRQQNIIDTEHYRRVADGLRYVAWRNNTFSSHVHVGIRDIDRAVQVCDRVRPLLPTLLAFSANSPFLEGRDSGLHSVRTQIFTKSFPRCGVPDAFGSWQTFREYLEFLLSTQSIVEYTQVWWSIRPHLTFGTVEVRICDAQTAAAESEALSGLITACVLQAARDIDNGVPHSDSPGRLIEENFWRAIRFGLDGELIDLETYAQLPAVVAVERLLEWTAELRAELGIELAFPVLNGAQRQRQELDAGVGIRDIFAKCIRQTQETYAESVVQP